MSSTFYIFLITFYIFAVVFFSNVRYTKIILKEGRCKNGKRQNKGTSKHEGQKI